MIYAPLRSFLSYDIEEHAVLAKIRDFQNSLLSTGADLKLVRPEILHFTVRFLGEISEEQKDGIIRALEGSVAPLDLEVEFKGLGTFPSEKRISVVWLDSAKEAAKKLTERAELIKRILDEKTSYLQKEEKAFNPHVTIARVRTGRNKDQLVSFLREHAEDEFGVARLGSLKLKMSILTPDGPSYSDLHVFK